MSNKNLKIFLWPDYFELSYIKILMKVEKKKKNFFQE